MRARMRQKIAAVKPLARAMEEELVNAAIMGTPEWRAADTVLLYKHKGAEFSVNSLANAAFRDGKRVCFPRVDGDNLTIRSIDSWAGLSPGSFGIDEPDPWAPKIDPENVGATVVPGLAWTKGGARVGQGGGFYDRLLPLLTERSFGVGFNVQFVDSLPTESHDVPVDDVWWASRITDI
jgi:5-formyltetrahydrofolate cyclo-ligase